jgi:hypothetical protein
MALLRPALMRSNHPDVVAPNHERGLPEDSQTLGLEPIIIGQKNRTFQSFQPLAIFDPQESTIITLFALRADDVGRKEKTA